MTLQEQYEQIVTRYVEAFLIKQGFHENGILYDYYFTGSGLSGVEVSDYYLSVDDIRLDIDREAEPGEIFKWYDDMMDKATEEKPYCNYDNWLKGAR